ncbi:MAG: dynamin family protein [Paraclostridium sp.]
MVGIFNKSTEQDIKINNIISDLENIDSKLIQYSEDIDISNILNIKENFKKKIEDFYREDRKLNIAIIGQVKAGKSSFLNTLLFDGKEILPKAVTPKTATLTKIEYSEKNSIEIDFYTVEEFESLKLKSREDSNSNEVIVAKEIMSMLETNNVDIDSLLGDKNYKIDFDTYDNLVKELNEYVGENGKYTPIVKSVTLKINNDKLKEISVVDTPGLNDPIASRTDKTRQFIEMCDVVFFLSKADRFLDKSDMDLLTAQLPQKGVKRMILICSKYDAGLLSVIYDEDDLSSAQVSLKRSLKKQANKVFEKTIEEYKTKGYEESFISVIDSCKTPLFISSMAHNMSNKNIDEYDEHEEIVYEGLNIDGDVDNEVLRDIGNFEKVKLIFDEVVEEKEETLIKKSNDFIPTLKNEVKIEIDNLNNLVERRLAILSTEDKENINNQKRIISNQINLISSNIENIFGEAFVKLEQNKIECLRDLRESMREYSNLAEKTGTKTHVTSYKVSTSTWYKPSTWGSSRTEYSTYEESYRYLDASDAIENIRHFANDCSSDIENSFNKSLDMNSMKRKLLNIIIEEFDVSDENYDPMYFKLLVEKTLNTIELPIIKIGISNFIEGISSNFSGEITDSSEKSELRKIVFKVISNLFDDISKTFEDETKEYKKLLESIKNKFSDALLENISSEFEIILKQFENKENEIKKGKEMLEVFEYINNNI